MQNTVRRSLREEVLETVKEYILKGHYMPGERIVIDAVAKQLGVSITPVREALHHLAAQGLVSVEPHKGFTVKKWSKKEIEDLLFLRMYLEKLAIRLFIERKSDSSVLAQIINKMKEAVETNDLHALTNHNSEFHKAILNGSGNEELCKIMNSLSEKLYRVRILSLSYPGRMNKSYEEHLSIYKTICEQNVVKAEKVIEDHINGVKDVLLARMNEGLI
ncbi:MAG TPA: GntR family transcriptional regulator [Pseudothermotoga sp.]|jgi:DNA-binding GntR family transcriptional regulator|uniref:GntR family transcriptional regulator n=1 Tax=Thermotoga profunda TaxID=1508420 RepID=UPI000597CC63|nr:GntR family transcriptional regulator [Thermotoga profunda]